MLPAGLMTAILRRTRESVLVTDAELDAPGPRILFVNEAFEETTGFRSEDVVGRTPRMLQGPRTDPKTLRRLRRCLEDGGSFEGTAINYRRDGSEFLNRWYIEPLRDDDGRITHFLSVQRDSTAEQRDQRRARLLANALSQQADGVVIVNAQGHVRFVNDAFVELVGIEREDLLGRQIRGSRLLSQISEHDAILKAVLAPPFHWTGEVRVQLREELLDLAISVARIQNHDGRIMGYSTTLRDVSERRRVEAVSGALNLSDNLGYMISGIRHELGNPINSIKTALSVLSSNLDRFDRAKQQQYLDRTLAEVERVEYLLRSLRSFNALEAPECEPVSIADFLSGFEPLVRRDLETEGVELEMVSEPNLTAMVDPRALHQVMLNLVTNAAKALDGQPRRRIAVIGSGSRRGPVIRVVDSGPGMSAEQQSRLFRPFQTGRRGGTGLGLVITRRLLASMNGTISITSKLGAGTVAEISLEEP